MDNNFYDDSELRKIDDEINEFVGQPTLVENMQERSEKAESARKGWSKEFRKHWYIYVILMVSSAFTAMLGLYMGLAPYLVPNLDGSKTLTFNDDWVHIITALVYAVAFLSVTEGAAGVFHKLFHEREDKNDTQYYTMLVGMILAVISIIFTGIAGGMVVSSVLGSLDKFKAIPPGAQTWVVVVIPLMLGLYFSLLISYKLSSRQAKAERIAKENEAKWELDQEVRMHGIQAIGKRRIQTAAILMFERMVMEGLLSQKEADWAFSSGLSLAEIEKKLGRDLTGGDGIGVVTGLKSQPAPRPAPQPFPMSPPPTPVSPDPNNGHHTDP